MTKTQTTQPLLLTSEDLATLLTDGLKEGAEIHAEEELDKIGTLRGGSAGCIGQDGVAYGECGRLAWLRSLGYEVEPDMNSRELFEIGLASEGALFNRLCLGIVRQQRLGLGASGWKLATQDQLKVQYTTAGGLVMTGRPDGGVVDAEGRLVFGVEAKMAASIWTVIGVSYDKRPRSDHLVQAATYSAMLGNLPFFLVYSVRCEYHLSTAPYFVQEKFTPATPNIELKNGKPFKIRNHTVVYKLDWDSKGRLTYFTRGMASPCPTQITANGIRTWYDRVSVLGATDVLPPRPTNKSVDGSKGFKACDYCDLASVCDSAGDGTLTAWVDRAIVEVKKIRDDLGS